MRPPLRPPHDSDTPEDRPAGSESRSIEDVLPDQVKHDIDEAHDTATEQEQGAAPAADLALVDNPFNLSTRELLFVEAFVGPAKFRAVKAYELAGYKTTGAAYRANASRMLQRERVADAIAARCGERVKALRIMDGDEALEGISNLGRVDIRKVVPHIKQIAELPDEVADAVKSITPTKYGLRIEMYDKLRARELMAKAGGKLKETVKHEHSLEDIMAAANGPAGDGADA